MSKFIEDWWPHRGTGVPPVEPRTRGVGRYSVRIDRSEALFSSTTKEDRSALADLAGVPANAADYRGHGRHAHATKSNIWLDHH